MLKNSVPGKRLNIMCRTDTENLCIETFKEEVNILTCSRQCPALLLLTTRGHKISFTQLKQGEGDCLFEPLFFSCVITEFYFDMS